MPLIKHPNKAKAPTPPEKCAVHALVEEKKLAVEKVVPHDIIKEALPYKDIAGKGPDLFGCPKCGKMHYTAVHAM